MLDYIETIWAGGSITFDTEAPDGDVDYIIALTLTNLGRDIRRAIKENKDELFVIRVNMCRRKDNGEE